MKKLFSVLYLWFPSLTIITVLLAFSVNTAFAGARPAASRAISVTAHMQFVNATPDTVVNGNCGDIVLNVYNLGEGEAWFDEQVSSSQGAIITLTYHLDWSNNNGGNNDLGGVYPLPGNPWTHPDYQYTQPGIVTATLTATDHVGLPAPLGKDCTGTVTSSNEIKA